MAQKTSNNKSAKTKANNTGGKKKMSAAEKKRLEEMEAKNFRREISFLLYFVVAVLILFITLIPGEHAWNTVHNFILGCFGFWSLPWALMFLYFAVRVGLNKQEKQLTNHFVICIMYMTLINLTAFLFFEGSSVDSENLAENFQAMLNAEHAKGAMWKGNGVLGAALGGFMMLCFGLVGSRIIMILVIFVIVMIVTRTQVSQLYKALFKPAQKIQEKRIEHAAVKKVSNRDRVIENLEKLERTDIKINGKAAADLEEAEKDLQEILGLKNSYSSQKEKKKEEMPDFEIFGNNQPVNEKAVNTAVLPEEEPNVETEQDELEKLANKVAADKKKQKKDNLTAESFGEEVRNMPENTENYTFPPLELLTTAEDIPSNDIAAELKSNGELLVKTLNDFHISTKIVDISRGPAVTRYELQPAPGVKISKITNLSDDIAMNLAASGVRIEAPIPGKSAVGIEIPNKTVSVVKARTIIDSEKFRKADSKLTVALGKDISGSIALADIAKMPHLLIAGSTGSGKSVCINSIITSILYKSSPDEVKLLMVDPKVVELGIYNGIPHLIVPVVTDPKKAASALAWAVSEMLKRYEAFAENNVRDIRGFNKLCEKNEELKKLPQIVIIIDELADLMMVAKKEVEDYIGRLTQMARAAGMHLIVATQRPSVDVITGVIKANIPSRIAFAVSSQVDSRTILDSSGAEKLIGRGDMLFMPVGANKPTRIQGCFVTDEEIEDVVTFIKNSSESNYDDDVAQEIETKALESSEEEDYGSDSDGLSDDPMFEKAVECVLEAGQASTSLLQRRLRLGYARAGRLIDEMETAGIVGPHEGSKPRQVIITSAQWMERKMTIRD